MVVIMIHWTAMAPWRLRSDTTNVGYHKLVVPQRASIAVQVIPGLILVILSAWIGWLLRAS